MTAASPAGRGTAWVLATRNAGKLIELRALFRDQGIAVIDLEEAGVPEAPGEDDLEVYPTFEENALAKARWFADRVGGRVVVADDSGLEVAALGGAPGVISKRWSGRADLHGAALDAENNAKLLAALADCADRRARFVCAAALMQRGREPVIVRGEVVGRIVDRASGTNGFGYDPHFFVDELGRTLADATLEEKQRASHRARAFIALLSRVGGG